MIKMGIFIKQIEDAALPIFITNWIFGIGIIEYPMGKQRRMISFIYTTIILIIYCSLAIYAYPYLVSMSREFETNKRMMRLLFYSNIFLTISTIIMGWYRSEGLRFILNQVSVADNLIEKMGVPRNYAKAVIVQIGKLAGFFTFILILILMNSLIMCMEDTLQSGHVISIIVMYYPYIILFIIDSSFVNIIGYSYKNMNEINGVLKDILTSTQDHPQHIRIIQNYLRNQETLETNIDENSFTTEDKTHIIQNAKKAHLTLVTICREADNTFGLHILLSLIVAIAVITITVYHIYELVLYTKVSQTVFYRVLGTASTWLFYYFIKIYALSHCCSKISEEAMITGDIISEIYDEPFISTETQKEIREFHVQMIQNPLKFGAHGFITIDFTLLENVIGSITTYLMILVQLGNFISP